MTYIRGVVEEVRKLAENIKEYLVKLEREVSPVPGQFAMLWMPRVGEIPLSFADADGSRTRFIVARVGRVTGFIHERIGEGSRIYLRGPLGRGFTQVSGGRCLLVAGGYGLAPLYFLAKRLRGRGCHVKTLLGFKSDREAFYREEFGELCEVGVAVEEGSAGFRGTAVDLLEKVLEREGFERVYTCGKEEMMIEVSRRCLDRGIPVEASLERYIRCGVGICGSCVLEPLGLRVCRDGPVFDGAILLRLDEERTRHDR